MLPSRLRASGRSCPRHDLNNPGDCSPAAGQRDLGAQRLSRSGVGQRNLAQAHPLTPSRLREGGCAL